MSNDGVKSATEGRSVEDSEIGERCHGPVECLSRRQRHSGGRVNREEPRIEGIAKSESGE
jgi:hypothetical protein